MNLSDLPLFMYEDGRRLYFTLGTYNHGWQAAYLDYKGYARHGFTSVGKTPEEAVDKLRSNLDLLKLLESPAIWVEQG